MSLVSSILGTVDQMVKARYNYGIVTIPRQINAIIDAANLIVAAFKQPYTPATPGMGLTEWLKCDDAGMSALWLAHNLSPNRDAYVPHKGYHFPLDADDFGRCHKFLEACPACRELITVVGHTGKEWSALVYHWLELTGLYTAGKHTELTARIRELTK
jgi:hypothetical protein